jgi:hypothetical protein
MLLVVGLLFAVCSLGAAALVGSVASDWASITDFYPSAPHLPDYAVPSGAERLSEYTSCGGTQDEWFPTCRTLTFGSSRPWDETKRLLIAELTGRDWSLTVDRATWISFQNEGSTICLSYAASETGPSTYPSSYTKGHTTMIHAFVNDCSDSGA